MKVLTFRGSTPSQALQRAKFEVGDECMLIETKEIEKHSIYEVIVAVKNDIEDENDDVLCKISNMAKQLSDVRDSSDEDAKKSRELNEIKSEITKLTDKVNLIQNMFWNEKAPDTQSQIPVEFAEIYRLALQSGMDLKHLDSIMNLTLRYMPSSMRENSSIIKKYFYTLLRKMVPIKEENTPSVGNKKVIMLVGPTGVGKTTSIAKLAARYSYLMQKKYKVGLVVLDTYRIGAVEQLMQYARMMKLGIETVVDPPEFSNALNSLKYCDYILIDTMGSSPYDKGKIEKIYECLDTNETEYDVEVVLVMSSSIKYEDLKITYENFSTLSIDTIMFTKLDETTGFGNIFSFAYEIQKPINYFSVGQEVPEDLVCASGDFLAKCLLDGFKKGSE